MNCRGILTAFGALQGTAHVLYTPAITPPADHLSQEAIGYSLDWFARTLTGGTPLRSTGQIWPRKELGTSIALIGFVMLLLGAFDLLLGWSTFASLRIFPPGQDAAAGLPQQSGPWWNGKLIDPAPLRRLYRSRRSSPSSSFRCSSPSPSSRLSSGAVPEPLCRGR